MVLDELDCTFFILGLALHIVNSVQGPGQEKAQTLLSQSNGLSACEQLSKDQMVDNVWETHLVLRLTVV